MRLLSEEDLHAIKGLPLKSRWQRYRDIKKGAFPKPVYPGLKPAWLEHEIDEYIARLAAARDGLAGRPA